MTTTVDITTVTDAISKLSIGSTVIKDADEIVDFIGLGTNVLMPRPKNFITGFRVEPVETTKQNLNVYYTLNYVYYHCQIGNNIFAVYGAMLTNLALILGALSSDTPLAGTMDHGAPRVGEIAGIPDPKGNVYHSCEISIDIMQFLEV